MATAGAWSHWRPGDAAQLCLVFGITATVYLLSAPHSVMLGDDGLFILAAWSNGIAHPPGYPLHTLLGRLFVLLPFGSVAWRVHALSGVCAALACCALWWLARRLLPGRTFAWLASLGLGFSATFWSQAIIAEVYTLNVLLCLVLLGLCWQLRQSRAPRQTRVLMRWAGLVLGLGLSNHWPLLVLFCGGLAVLVPGRAWRQLGYALPPLCLGLLPYAGMVARSLEAPPISFYGPLDSPYRLWFMLSRQGYAEVDQQAAAGWWDKGQYLLFLGRELGRQFTLAGGLLLAIGWLQQWRVWPHRLCLALNLACAGCSLLLILLLGFDYDGLHAAMFRVYPLPAYAICALWMALGGATLTGVLAARWAAMPAWLKPALCALLVTGNLLSHLAHNHRPTDRWAENYARTVLQTAPPDAILFSATDFDAGPLAYMHRIMGLRPDIRLYHKDGLMLRDRLHDPSAWEPDVREQAMDSLVRHSGRPVLYTRWAQHLYRHANADYGLYYRLHSDMPSVIWPLLLPQIDRYWRWLDRLVPPDLPLQRMHYFRLLQARCRVHFGRALRNGIYADWEAQLRDIEDRHCNTHAGRMEMANILLQIDTPRALQAPVYDHIGGLLRRARAQWAEAYTKADQADYYLARGRHLLALGAPAQARDMLVHAVDLWPFAENPAHALLARIQPDGSDAAAE